MKEELLPMSFDFEDDGKRKRSNYGRQNISRWNSPLCSPPQMLPMICRSIGGVTPAVLGKDHSRRN